MYLYIYVEVFWRSPFTDRTEYHMQFKRLGIWHFELVHPLEKVSLKKIVLQKTGRRGRKWLLKMLKNLPELQIGSSQQ